MYVCMYVSVPCIFKFTLVHACLITPGFVCLLDLVGHFFLKCASICLYLCKYITHMRCSQRPEEGTGSSGTGITSSCGLPSGHWELNLGLLKKQSSLHLKPQCVWMDSTEQQCPAQERRKVEEIVFLWLCGQKWKQDSL